MVLTCDEGRPATSPLAGVVRPEKSLKFITSDYVTENDPFGEPSGEIFLANLGPVVPNRTDSLIHRETTLA